MCFLFVHIVYFTIYIKFLTGRFYERYYYKNKINFHLFWNNQESHVNLSII